MCILLDVCRILHLPFFRFEVNLLLLHIHLFAELVSNVHLHMPGGTLTW